MALAAALFSVTVGKAERLRPPPSPPGPEGWCLIGRASPTEQHRGRDRGAGGEMDRPPEGICLSDWEVECPRRQCHWNSCRIWASPAPEEVMTDFRSRADSPCSHRARAATAVNGGSQGAGLLGRLPEVPVGSCSRLFWGTNGRASRGKAGREGYPGGSEAQEAGVGALGSGLGSRFRSWPLEVLLTGPCTPSPAAT